jgi:O-antigen ligase
VSEAAKNKTKLFFEKALEVLVCLTFMMFSFGTAPFTICSLAALSLWVLSGICYRKRSAWLRQEWLLPVILLMLLPWIAMIWSPVYSKAVSHASRSYYWLFSLIAASVITSEHIMRRVVNSYLAGILVTSTVVLLYSYSVLPGPLFMRSTITSGYISYSLLVVSAIVLLSYYFRDSDRRLMKMILGSLILILILSISQLKGRSGYLALLFVSPWVFCTMFGSRRIFPILAALTVFLILMSTSQNVRSRVALIPHEIKLYMSADRSDTPVGARLEMWQVSWKIFCNNPLLGAGTAGLWHESNKLKPGHGLNHPHNNFLYMASNYGIVGLALFVWLLYITAIRAWNARDRLPGHVILVFFTVIMIGGLTDTQILSAVTGTLLGFVAGIPTDDGKECAS